MGKLVDVLIHIWLKQICREAKLLSLVSCLPLAGLAGSISEV